MVKKSLLGVILIVLMLGEKNFAEFRPYYDFPRPLKTEVYYVVDDHALMLSSISLMLYGSARYYAKLAEWNGMSAPYKIFPGQRLRLEKAPTIPLLKGRELLRTMWAKRLNSKYENLRAKEGLSDSAIYFDAAIKLFEKGHYSLALLIFEKIRKNDPGHLINRIYEIKTLINLKRLSEANSLIDALLQDHPETLKQLTVFGIGQIK